MPKAKRSSSSEKCPKVWEKARRDKLKGFFDELGHLLPEFDPTNPPSRVEIIQGAMVHIRQLQSQNEDLLKGGFDEVYRNKLEKWKRRVKDLVCRVEQLTEILRTANIHVPPLALETAPFWTKNRPKPWTKRIFIPEDKIAQVLERMNQPKKRKTKIPKLVQTNGSKVSKKKKKNGKVIESKENQPDNPIAPLNADTIVTAVKIAPQAAKKTAIPTLNVSLNSVTPLASIPTLSSVSFPTNIISGQPSIIQQQAPSVFPGNIVAQPNTYILTNQGNLLPVLTPSTNVLTPVIINRPPPLLVVQQPVVAHQWRPLPMVAAKPPPNKRRIERESTVMTYTNKIPISALSKHSHARRGGKCAAHKTEKLNSNPQTGLSSSIAVVSPTAAFLNTFPVVSTSKTDPSDTLSPVDEGGKAKDKTLESSLISRSPTLEIQPSTDVTIENNSIATSLPSVLEITSTETEPVPVVSMSSVTTEIKDGVPSNTEVASIKIDIAANPIATLVLNPSVSTLMTTLICSPGTWTTTTTTTALICPTITTSTTLTSTTSEASTVVTPKSTDVASRTIPSGTVYSTTSELTATSFNNTPLQPVSLAASTTTQIQTTVLSAAKAPSTLSLNSGVGHAVGNSNNTVLLPPILNDYSTPQAQLTVLSKVPSTQSLNSGAGHAVGNSNNTLLLPPSLNDYITPQSQLTDLSAVKVPSTLSLNNGAGHAVGSTNNTLLLPPSLNDYITPQAQLVVRSAAEVNSTLSLSSEILPPRSTSVGQQWSPVVTSIPSSSLLTPSSHSLVLTPPSTFVSPCIPVPVVTNQSTFNSSVSSMSVYPYPASSSSFLYTMASASDPSSVRPISASATAYADLAAVRPIFASAPTYTTACAVTSAPIGPIFASAPAYTTACAVRSSSIGPVFPSAPAYTMASAPFSTPAGPIFASSPTYTTACAVTSAPIGPIFPSAPAYTMASAPFSTPVGPIFASAPAYTTASGVTSSAMGPIFPSAPAYTMASAPTSTPAGPIFAPMTAVIKEKVTNIPNSLPKLNIRDNSVDALRGHIPGGPQQIKKEASTQINKQPVVSSSLGPIPMKNNSLIVMSDTIRSTNSFAVASSAMEMIGSHTISRVAPGREDIGHNIVKTTIAPPLAGIPPRTSAPAIWPPYSATITLSSSSAPAISLPTSSYSQTIPLPGQMASSRSQSSNVDMMNPFAPSWAPSSAAISSGTGVSWSPITTSVSAMRAPQLPPMSADPSWLTIPTGPINETPTTSVKFTDGPTPVEWRPMPSEALWSTMDPWNYPSSAKGTASHSKQPTISHCIPLGIPSKPSEITNTTTPGRITVPNDMKVKRDAVNQINHYPLPTMEQRTVEKTASGMMETAHNSPLSKPQIITSVYDSQVSSSANASVFNSNKTAIYTSLPKVSLAENIMGASSVTPLLHNQALQNVKNRNIPTSCHGSRASQTNFAPLPNLFFQSQPHSSAGIGSPSCQSYSNISHLATSRQKQGSECILVKASSANSMVPPKTSLSISPYSTSTSKPLLGESLFPPSHPGNYPLHESSLYNSISDHGYSSSLLKPTLPESTYIASLANAFSSEPSFSTQPSYSLAVPRTLLQSDTNYSLTHSKTPMSDTNFFPANSIETMYPVSFVPSGKDPGKGQSVGSFPMESTRRSAGIKSTSVSQYPAAVQSLVNSPFPSSAPTSIKHDFPTTPQKTQRNAPACQKESTTAKQPTVPVSSGLKLPGNEPSTALWNAAYFPQTQSSSNGIPPENSVPWSQVDYSCIPEAKDSKPKPPINWMTEPDPRIDGVCPTEDPFQPRYQNFLDRKDTISSQNMFEYCLTNLPEEEGSKGRSKKKEADGGCPDYFSWLSMKVDPLVVPCTLPTLVGDLALGSEPTPTKRPKLSDSYAPPKLGKEGEILNSSQEPFANLSKNIFDCSQNELPKPNNSSETIVLKNIFELPTPSKRKMNQGQNSFLSVSYLVEPNTIEEIGGKADCTYYSPRGKGKRGSGWKCAEKKCQQSGKACSSYSAEALLRSSGAISQGPMPEPDYNLPNPGVFPQEFPQDTNVLDNHQNKPKTYSKQRKQESWKGHEFQQTPPATFASLMTPPSSTQNFTSGKTILASKPPETPFSFPYLTDSRLPAPQPPNIALSPAMSGQLPYPKFPGNSPGPLFAGPSFPQQKPGEPVPFSSVFPPAPSRPCVHPDGTLLPPGTRYPGPRKSFSYSRPNKAPFPQFSPSFAYDGSKKLTSKSGMPIVQSSNSVFPAPLPVGGPYPTFPALPSQPVGPSGNSLANFNLTTIFPEMNKKGNYQYP